jgi:hypothetical protein
MDSQICIYHIYIFMKLCGFTCIVAAGIVVSMLLMTFNMLRDPTMVSYEKQLPVELRKKYHQIVQERRNIYYTGYTLGFALAFFVIIYNAFILDKPYLTTSSIVCVSIVIAFFTNHLYYTLTPKTDWMLNHVHDPLQTKAWLKMYHHMQYYYHISFLLGIIGVGVFAASFRCNKYILS